MKILVIFDEDWLQRSEQKITMGLANDTIELKHAWCHL